MTWQQRERVRWRIAGRRRFVPDPEQLKKSVARLMAGMATGIRIAEEAHQDE